MDFLVSVFLLIMSVVIHEVSHGWAAYALGDSTAKYAGRLTFNPIKHMDPWGSFLIPLLLIISNSGILFGWAKPVPYNPYNLKDQKYGPAMVGAAGPLSNIVLALIAGVFLRVFLVAGVSSLFWESFFFQMVTINIVLAVFNLLPIPPLDGSKLLFAVLPISEYTKMNLERYGFAFLFVFLFMFSGILEPIMTSVLGFFMKYVIYFGIM